MQIGLWQTYLHTKFQLSSITVVGATIVFVKVSDRSTNIHKETSSEKEEEEEEEEEAQLLFIAFLSYNFF